MLKMWEREIECIKNAGVEDFKHKRCGSKSAAPARRAKNLVYLTNYPAFRAKSQI